MDQDTLERMLVEVANGQPRTVKGPEAEKLYDQLEDECAEIEERGGIVDVPAEIPDL